MAKRVGGDVLLDPGSRRGAPDDVGEDRLLQAGTVEPAEDRVGWPRLPGVSQLQQLAGEASGDRLTPGLVAFPMADEQGPLASVELEVAPLERAQLRATKAGRDEGDQHELVTLGEAGQVPLRLPGRVEQPLELLARQPVALLPWLRRRVEVAERVERADAPADPAEEAAQDEKAAVVGRRRRVCPLPVGGSGSRRSSLPPGRCDAAARDQSSRSSIATRYATCALWLFCDVSSRLSHSSRACRSAVPSQEAVRCGSRRAVELAEARGNHDERRPVVLRCAGVDECCLERRQRCLVCRA